jgi:hypothetical protein
MFDEKIALFRRLCASALLFALCMLLPCLAYGQTPGTATVSLGGFNTSGDYGFLAITVNGLQVGSTPYGPDMVYPYIIAGYLANSINSGNPYVTASTPGLNYNPAVITLTAKTSGSNTNYPLSVTVYSYSGMYPTGYTLTPSGPTLTGGSDAPAPVTGFINPKYMIVGVTYAPPGAQSNVTYTNSILVGNTSSVSKTFSDQTSVSVSVSSGISAWGTGGKITGTSSTSYTQGSSSSSSVNINKTTTQSDRVSGPANSFVGLDHDYDVIWLWLNPVLPITFTDQNNPRAIAWNGYGYDPNDQPGMDIFPVFVGWLNGDIPLPADVAQVLARSWALGYTWGPGQGPSLTGPGLGTDFDMIVRVDPFWQCHQAPANCPTTPDLTRFTLSSNQNLVYAQAPVGGQPITQTYQLQYSNTSTQGQGTTSTFSQGFALEQQFSGSLFGINLGVNLKESNTLTWSTSVNTSITNTSGSSALASVTGPTCTVPSGGNTCSPEYDGPAEFDVYQDNQYGTFMFFPVNSPRFRLSVTPATQKVPIGGNTTYAVSTTAVDGFTGNIDLTVTGQPAGVTANFTTTPIAAGGSSTLTVNTSSSTPSGSYTLIITAVSGAIRISVPVTLVVQDFSLTAMPSSQSIAAGGNTTYTVTTAGLNGLGFNSNVTLSVGGGMPSGASVTFAPNPIAGVGSSTLTVTVPGSAAAGNYQFNVIGTSGSLSHNATVNLTVLAPDFTISATPSSISVVPGGCASYTVSTTALNGFTGTISLSQSGAPSGASAIFNPLSIVGAGSSTLTVCTSSSTPAGSYTINITGINGTVNHGTPVILVVQDFSLSATPGSQTVIAGTGTSYTVSTGTASGFTGTVSLSISGFPSGATATFNPTSISGVGSSTLTVSTSSSTPVGTYTLTITGTSATVSRSTTVTLIVSGPDFTIGATPASVTISRGGTANYTVNIGALNGFSGSVSLSTTGKPSRTTATFTPASITGSGTSTLRITSQSTVARGTYTLTVTGTSGSGTHSTTVTLVIQ